MPYSITALELVNRVLRRMRDETVGNFADDKSQVILDLVNAAKDDVLTSRDWDFDLRHDGVIVTRKTISTESGVLAQHNTTFFDSALNDHVFDPPVTPPSLFGDVITRFEYQGDATSSNEESGQVGTIWRMVDFTTLSIATGALDAEWPGASTSTAKLKFFMAEYLLPDTVRDVVSMTNQNGVPLDLDHVDPGASFDQLIPDLAERFAAPEMVAVGGFDKPTIERSVGDDTPKLRVVFFPVPDDEYRINYSYYYNHPDLVETTDTLKGVRPNVIASIVDRATADAVQTVQHRVRDGVVLEGAADRRLGRKFDSQSLQPAKRNNVRSWESRGGGHRNHVGNGFPGRTLGP